MVALAPHEQSLICSVFHKYREVERVEVFGSRASGKNRPESDIDLVAWGAIDERLQARILAELEELPLPYLFDFRVYDAIEYGPLIHHINTVGQEIYRRDDNPDR